jgi:hypothetical protein
VILARHPAIVRARMKLYNAGRRTTDRGGNILFTWKVSSGRPTLSAAISSTIRSPKVDRVDKIGLEAI